MKFKKIMHFFLLLVSVINCIFSKAINESRESYNFVDSGSDLPKKQALVRNEVKLDELDEDNFIDMWNRMNLDEDDLGSLRGYNRRRKPPEYYDKISSSVITTTKKSKTVAITQNSRFLKEFLKKTSTFLSFSEFLQSRNLTLVDFLNKSDREVQDLLTTKPLFIVQKGSIPIKKNKLVLKPQIVTINYVTTSTTIPSMVNETYLLNDRVRAEIYEVFSNAEKRSNLLRILTELNMTINDLIEHRERGSSHRHLAEIFHRNRKEPEVYNNTLVIEQKMISDTTKTADTSRNQSQESEEIFIVPIPTTNRSKLLPIASPKILTVNVEDTILVTLSIVTIALLSFLIVYVFFYKKKRRRLNEQFLDNRQIFDRFVISKAPIYDYDYKHVNYFNNNIG